MVEIHEAIGGGILVLPMEMMALQASAPREKVLVADILGTLKPLLQVSVGQVFFIQMRWGMMLHR